MNIYCYPFHSETNDYIKNSIKIWNELGFNVFKAPRNFKEIFKINPIKKDVIILNWFEERPSKSRFPFIEFIRTIVIYLYLRCVFSKVIYVKHNIKPHNNKGILYFTIIAGLMKLTSTLNVVHRDNFKKNHKYIPHPLYNHTLVDSKRDIDYLYFGNISKYKALDKLLRKWPKSKTLKIIGSCDSDALKEEIESIIIDNNLSVVWNSEFVPLTVLEAELKKAKFVLIPHSDNSMIVSGSFFHAASLGANVLMHKSRFSEYCNDKFSFVSIYEDDLDSTMCRAKEVDCRVIFDELNYECGNDRLMSRWKEVLRKENENSSL